VDRLGAAAVKETVVVLLLLISGCTPCGPFDRSPEWVCASSAGVIREGAPFSLTATVTAYKSENVNCSVAIDGGTIALTIGGQDCQMPPPGLGAAKPVVPKVTVQCGVPALDAGQYVVAFNSSFNVVINADEDAGTGVPNCE